MNATIDKNREALLEPGIYAAVLTPMHEDFTCNDEALASHCQDLMQRGCKGVVLFGTTGEGSSFSTEESEKAIKKLIELGIHPKKIIIGIISCAIDDVKKLTTLGIW